MTPKQRNASVITPHERYKCDTFTNGKLCKKPAVLCWQDFGGAWQYADTKGHDGFSELAEDTEGGSTFYCFDHARKGNADMLKMAIEHVEDERAEEIEDAKNNDR